jgi:hypothetical protein
MSRWLRTSIGATLVALGSACPAIDIFLPTPLERFYYPTALAHFDNPQAPQGNGLLAVASSNFDKRFVSGSATVLNLDQLPVPLPAFGSVPASPIQLPLLRPVSSDGRTRLEPDGGSGDAVAIAPFAGQMAVLPMEGNRWRLFIPTRSEDHRVHALDVTLSSDGVPSLSCFGSESRSCLDSAPSLTRFRQSTSGLPRAPEAYGVALRARVCSSPTDCGDPSSRYGCRLGRCVSVDEGGQIQGPAVDVLVTHLAQADTPQGSGRDLRGYLVKLESETMTLTEQSFIDLGPGATHSIAVGSRWNFVSGRLLNPAGNLVRMVDTTSRIFVSSGIETTFRVAEARGIALSSDERRLYMIGRSPDALLVASIDDATATTPTLRVVRGVPLPETPNEMVALSRPGRGDLLAIVCINAGVLAVYDDDVGDVVAQVPGVGVQPFGVAVDRRGGGARLFVSNLGDGRVAVIDMPDLNRPQGTRLVAHLGAQQLCLIRPGDPSCVDAGVPDVGRGGQ